MQTLTVPEIGPGEALRVAADGATLLDVREPAEWGAGHAPRAEHVPLAALPVRAGRCLAGERVVVLCRSGARARTATALLRRRGVEAYTLAGGMTAWQAAGGPVVRDGGGPGTVA
jgi:rhodanese-related sulfurtransferase